MTDQRQHRGPHPQDRQLFGADQWPRLRRAVADLSWLWTRGYSEVASLKLVGDRYGLTARQRVAVRRCACSDDALARRVATAVGPAGVRGRAVRIDAFNLIITLEAALAGGVLLIGRDHALRDMASMHGSYRKVAETARAAELTGAALARLGVREASWLIDRPVSNSGRLRAVLLEIAGSRGWPWRAEVVADPDAELVAGEATVVSADSVVLDGCGRWINLARLIVEADVLGANRVDLRATGGA